MRIESFHIQHFGHFDNVEMQLPSSPLTVLCGQNEAGKSTLLEFLRQLLFGFHERTPYNFGSGEINGTAVLTLADQRRVELRRRKGRKNTVQARVEGRNDELDDQAFRQLLGNANENLFRSVFAFGLHELRQGDEALREENLQTALFGSGLGGGSNPKAILEELDKEAGQLFLPKGNSKRSINILASEIKALKTEVGKKQIRSEEYERREEAWKGAKQLAEKLGEQLRERKQAYDHAEQMLKAYPIWLQMRTLATERASIVAPPALPQDAEHTFSSLHADLARLESELESLQQEQQEFQRELHSLTLDKTLLSQRDEIEECHQLIKSVSDARHDLPELRSRQAKLERELDDELQRLRSGWTTTDLQRYCVTAEQSHRLEALYQRRAELDQKRTKLATQQTDVEDKLRQLAEDLAALFPDQDVTTLRELLDGADEIVADQKALQRDEEEQERLEHALASQAAGLFPALPPESSSSGHVPLSVPPRDLISQKNEEHRRLLQQKNMAQQRLAEAESELAKRQAECEALAAKSGKVPSLEELQTNRQHRDALWQGLRKMYLEQPSPAAPAAEVVAFERSLANSDQIADQIYERADDVARREELQRRIKAAATAVEQGQKDCANYETVLADFDSDWVALWQSCGFQPLAPDLMLGWFDDYAKFRQSRDRVDAKKLDIDRCRARLQQATVRLQTLLGSQEEDLKTLLTTAKRHVREADSRSQKREQLEGERRRADKQVKKFTSERAELESLEQQWGEDWQTLLTELSLPPDWGPDLVRKVTSELRATREKWGSFVDQQRRIEQMEQRLTDFDPRVRKLCDQLSVTIDGERPEATARVLHERLSEALRLDERRGNLEQRIAENHEEIRQKQAVWREKQLQREQLLKWAEAADDAEFFAAAERARHARQLDDELRSLGNQLTLLRGKEPEEQFQTALEAVDPSVLQAQVQEWEHQITSGSRAANEAREQAGSARRQFEELDGSDEAVLLQEQVAQHQARLAAEIHRYVPVVFAKLVLQSAIQRFQRDNQPAMIKDISQLFATMTAGRYSEIERPAGDEEAIFVRRADGRELTPNQLSTGTREQLYLAIRLGYILHYCRSAEPLPIVMDDVLVNFDAHRARATLKAIRRVAEHVQILFFTCHHHTVHLIREVFPDVSPQEVPGARPPA